MAVLADTMPTEQLGITMGTVGSVVSLAMVSAPALGGTIYQTFGYEAVFWVLGGMLVIDVILRLLMIERRDAKKWGIDIDSDPAPESDENTALLENSQTQSTSVWKMFVVFNRPFPCADVDPTVSDSGMDGVYVFYHFRWPV